MPRSGRSTLLAAAVAVVTALPLCLSAATASAAPAKKAGGISGVAVSAHRVGTSSALTGGTGGELRPPDDDSVAATVKAVANRSPHSRAKAGRGTPPLSGINPTQTLTAAGGESGFQGINHYDQRTTDGGNQFSLVPPDQGLCAGNGQVVESVNNAIHVYGTDGSSLAPVISVDRFYWNDSEIIRATGVASPHQMGDLTCVYDAGSDRFYMAAYDLVSDAGANPLGPSFTDIAVSPVGTALGTWTIYQVDGTNDGNGTTVSHPNCPCFGDYPHIGTDANGFYLSTNEYPTLVAGYNGANVYAFDKARFASGSGLVSGVLFNTARTDLYQGVLYDGFTLAPAVSPGTNYAPNSMYFLSSDSYSGDTPIVSRQILVWKIANTAALHTNPASLQLTHTTVATDPYFPPPPSDQKPGSVPLADCLNLTACSKLVLGTPDRYKEYEYAFDSSDTRMLQSAYANGKLWGALGTASMWAGWPRPASPTTWSTRPRTPW